MNQSRELVAIMFTDIVGYTSLMGSDSEKALEIVRISSKLQKDTILKHNGVWLKEMGDGVLAKFSTALDSVRCAIEIQKIARSELDAKLRIGIHLGDVTVQNNEVLGDGVNIASRIESIADAGGIYVSDTIHKAIQGSSDIQYVFLGDVGLKNVSYRVGVYAIQGTGLPLAEPNKLVQTSFMNEIQKGGILLTGFIYLILSAVLYLITISWYSSLKPNIIPVIVLLGLPVIVFISWKLEKDSNRIPEKLVKRNRTKRNIVIAGLALVILIFYVQNKDSDVLLDGRPEIKDKSIAVLPFTNMSSDEDQQYFADGMMEDILNHLSKIRQLKVISRTSSEVFRNRQGKSLPEIASELGVAYVLEGSVQKDQNTARITVQLINANEDRHVWSENYDRELKDIFRTQTQISKMVAEVLLAKLFPSELKLIELEPTSNISAYDLFLQGRRSLNIARDFYNENQNDLAIDHFKTAISQESNFAVAKASLGQAYLNKVLLFGEEDYWIDSALSLANEAVEINPNIPDAHLLKGAIYRSQGLEQESIGAYQRVLDLNPNSSESYNVLASMALKDDTSTRTLNYQFKALELDPLNPNRLSSVTNILQELQTHIDTITFGLDKLFPVIVPRSNIISIGRDYSAEIYLVAGTDDLNPTMLIDGKRLDMKRKYIDPGNEISYGNLKFKVTGGGEVVLGEDYRKKSYNVNVAVGNKVFTKKVEYFIEPPDISVISRSVSTLWMNCANELTVLVPEMIDGYSPKIVATNADIIQGVGGSVTIIPLRQRNIQMSVVNLRDTLGTFTFKVKRIPYPSFEMSLGGRLINLQEGISPNQIRGDLTIKVIPDESFASEAPLDARYRIENTQVILGGTNLDARTGVFGGETVDLDQILAAGPRKGEILVVKIHKLIRINFKEEVEDLSTKGLVYAIQIK